MIENIAKESLLYDFYGELLTARQKDVMKLYHEENLSLSEIADEFGISRQGVHDALKNAEKSLQEYEEKLGLIRRFIERKDAMASLHKDLESLIEDNKENEELARQLTGIKEIIENIDNIEQ